MTTGRINQVTFVREAKGRWSNREAKTSPIAQNTRNTHSILSRLHCEPAARLDRMRAYTHKQTKRGQQVGRVKWGYTKYDGNDSRAAYDRCTARALR